MKIIIWLFFAALLYSDELVIKYAVNQKELFENAYKTQQLLKSQNTHLGVIKNSDMLISDGGLTALKMGYIELYAADAKELQFIITSVWVKLESAKNGNENDIREALKKLGFELIKIYYFNNKTVMIIANSSAVSKLDSTKRKILEKNL